MNQTAVVIMKFSGSLLVLLTVFILILDLCHCDDIDRTFFKKKKEKKKEKKPSYKPSYNNRTFHKKNKEKVKKPSYRPSYHPPPSYHPKPGYHPGKEPHYIGIISMTCFHEEVL